MCAPDGDDDDDDVGRGCDDGEEDRGDEADTTALGRWCWRLVVMRLVWRGPGPGLG